MGNCFWIWLNQSVVAERLLFRVQAIITYGCRDLGFVVRIHTITDTIRQTNLTCPEVQSLEFKKELHVQVIVHTWSLEFGVEGLV